MYVYGMYMYVYVYIDMILSYHTMIYYQWCIITCIQYMEVS